VRGRNPLWVGERGLRSDRHMRLGTGPCIGAAGDVCKQTVRVRLGSYEFRKKGVSRFDPRDPYHFAIALSWPQFLATLLALYTTVNLVFATLFWIVPGSVAGARPHDFAQAFFFSIETLSTVSYGEMYPETFYGHLIAAIEIVCGLGFTAIVTGLTFVRFSRPRAKLVFAANAVVATHGGKPTLMIRVGNGRLAVLLDAVAKLNVLLTTASPEGVNVRRAQELRLERSHLPAFPLTWTLMHVLDERSPLNDYTEAKALTDHVQLFVTLEARDPTLAAAVYDIHSYAAENIKFGMRYADAVAMTEDGAPVADLCRIGSLESDDGEHFEHGWTAQETASGW
jgi:inward rectifier potassium channel